MSTLLEKVKANLILDHSEDDELLQRLIDAAVAYAESYQHLTTGTYEAAAMPATTEQAVIMLASHFYESRDGSTGGFFADNVQAGQQTWAVVNTLVRFRNGFGGWPLLPYSRRFASIALFASPRPSANPTLTS